MTDAHSKLQKLEDLGASIDAQKAIIEILSGLNEQALGITMQWLSGVVLVFNPATPSIIPVVPPVLEPMSPRMLEVTVYSAPGTWR